MLLLKSEPARPAARLRLLAATTAALLAAGCAQGSLETGALSSLAPEPSAATAAAAGASAATPAQTLSGPIAEARDIRAKGDKAKALAHLDKAAVKAPKDREIMKERGLLALELGQVKKAEDYLRKAHDPVAPDWRLHSALGSALASSGRHNEAQMQFSKALELAPDHPSVLNNLALSYALDGKHDEAERLLKRVTARSDAAPKAQQNLALIMDLKGKHEEAAKIAAAIVPAAKPQPAEAAVVSRAEPVASPPIRAAASDSAGDLHARAFGPAN